MRSKETKSTQNIEFRVFFGECRIYLFDSLQLDFSHLNRPANLILYENIYEDGLAQSMIYSTPFFALY